MKLLILLMLNKLLPPQGEWGVWTPKAVCYYHMPLGPIQYMPTSCKLELYQGNSHTYNMINASLVSVCRSHSSCIFPRREGRFQTSLFHRKTSLFPVLLCCIRCHSSKTAVMSVTETLKAARAAAQSSLINWVDLSVALVMVNHHILLINSACKVHSCTGSIPNSHSVCHSVDDQLTFSAHVGFVTGSYYLSTTKYWKRDNTTNITAIATTTTTNNNNNNNNTCP